MVRDTQPITKMEDEGLVVNLCCVMTIKYNIQV